MTIEDKEITLLARYIAGADLVLEFLEPRRNGVRLVQLFRLVRPPGDYVEFILTIDKMVKVGVVKRVYRVSRGILDFAEYTSFDDIPLGTYPCDISIWVVPT